MGSDNETSGPLGKVVLPCRWIDHCMIRAFVEVGLALLPRHRTCVTGGATQLPARRQSQRALDRIEIFEKLDVATTCNLMLVHPYSTVGTIERGLSLVERMRDDPL